MFFAVFAALWSRCRLVPQSGQECQRITTYHASQLHLGADEHRQEFFRIFG